MNERIKKLLEQSTKLDCWYKGESVSIVDYKMFAELIVRECLEQCNVNFVGTVGTHPSAHNRGVKKCIDNIKEHFGVIE